METSKRVILLVEFPTHDQLKICCNGYQSLWIKRHTFLKCTIGSAPDIYKVYYKLSKPWQVFVSSRRQYTQECEQCLDRMTATIDGVCPTVQTHRFHGMRITQRDSVNIICHVSTMTQTTTSCENFKFDIFMYRHMPSSCALAAIYCGLFYKTQRRFIEILLCYVVSETAVVNYYVIIFQLVIFIIFNYFIPYL